MNGLNEMRGDVGYECVRWNLFVMQKCHASYSCKVLKVGFIPLLLVKHEVVTGGRTQS